MLISAHRRLAIWLTPLTLVFVMLVQTNSFQQNTSATYDEPTYQRLGRDLYYHRDFTGFIRPMVQPIPILADVPAAIAAGTAEPAPEQLPRLTRIARFSNSLLFGAPVVVLVYVWLLRRRGWLAGTVGAGLLALDPNFIGVAAVATPDMCFVLFALIAVACLATYYRAPSWRAYGVLCVATGLALASKTSAVFLFPCFFWIDWQAKVRAGASQLRSAWRAALGTIGLILIGLCVNWALYFFALSPVLAAGVKHQASVPLLGSGPFAERVRNMLETVPVPASLTTLLGQIAHNARGHSAYLLGEVSRFGWHYYFPVAVGVKATPADLILLVVAVIALIRFRQQDLTFRVWLVSGLVFGALCLASKLNLGIRYLAPLYPLLILVSVDYLARIDCSRWRALALLTLLGSQAVTAASAWPAGHLSYFNAFVGGPANGHKYLADSNLDWGQDLPPLREVMASRHWNKVAIAYFGELDPNLYGVRSVKWDINESSALEDCQALAISVTILCGVEYGPEIFAGFATIERDASAGFGIWIYDLSRPEVKAALDDARQLRFSRAVQRK
jgi:hypothetical protein